MKWECDESLPTRTGGGESSSSRLSSRLSQPLSPCRSSTCTFRVALRLALLRITRRPLVSPPIPERDFDPASLPPSSIHSSPTLAPTTPLASPPATPDHLKNNRMPLEPSPLMLTSLLPGRSDTSVEDYLLPKALTTSSVRPPLQLVRPLTSIQDWVAECIYILRPLIYGTLPFCSITRLTNHAKSPC